MALLGLGSINSDFNLRPAQGTVSYMHGSGMLFDNPVNHGQSEASSFPHRLGGKKRIADFGDKIFRDPRSIVLNAKNALGHCIFPFQSDLAIWGLSCLDGVLEQVDQHLFQS